MQITIDESEITEAITQYIAAQGFLRTDAEVSITLTAGRGANGHSATIEINKKTIAPERPESHNTKQEPFNIPTVEEKKTRKPKEKTPDVQEAEELLEEAVETPTVKSEVEVVFDSEEPTESTEDVSSEDIESLFGD